MGVVLIILANIVGLAMLVCVVVVVVAMFKNGKRGLGIACILLIVASYIVFMVAIALDKLLDLDNLSAARAFGLNVTGIAHTSVMNAVMIGTWIASIIGNLIAFVAGWVHAEEWKIKRMMLVWTVCIVAVLAFLVFV
jgi:hypothetical protein